MRQQQQRPVRLSEQHRPAQDDTEGIWSLSAREFMKLPLSGLLSTRKPFRFTRLMLPDQVA